MTTTLRKDRVKTILDIENGEPIHEEKIQQVQQVQTSQKKEPFLTGVETSIIAVSVVGATGITAAVNLGKDIPFTNKLRNVSIAFISSIVAAVIIVFLLRLAFGKKTDKGVVSLIKDK